MNKQAHGNRFSLLWASSAVSNIGDGVGLAAAPLLAAALTRDPALVAGLTIAQRLPWFVFSLVSGALVDRLDRRRVHSLANGSRALLLGVLGTAVLGGWVTLPLLYAVFFLLGTAETLVDNAALALLPAIVPKERLEHANGRLFATQTVANEFVGPPLGAWLFGVIAAGPFFANAASFGLAGMLVLLLPGRFQAHHPDDQPRSSLWHDMMDGVRWFWQHRLLRSFGIMASIDNFCSAATSAIFVLFAQDMLGLSNVQYGVLLAGGAGGGVIGGLAAKWLVARLGMAWTIFVTNLLPGLAYLVIAAFPQAVVVGTMFVLASFASMVGNVVLISLRQTIIPDHLLGRVTSAYRVFALGSPPLGALAGGVLAQRFGLAMPYWAGGMILIMLAFVLLRTVNAQTIAQAHAPDVERANVSL